MDNFHLIRKSNGKFEIIEGTEQEAKSFGQILAADTVVDKLKILLMQLTQFKSWKTVLVNDEVNPNQLETTQISTSDNEHNLLKTKEYFDQPKPSTSKTAKEHCDQPQPSTSESFSVTGTNRGKRYSMSSSEEEATNPFETDEDKSYSCPSSSPESSSSGREDSFQIRRVQNVKKLLFRDERHKSSIVSSDRSTPTSACTSVPDDSSCVSTHISTSKSPLFAAHFNICTKSSKVTLKTEMTLHKGVSYECNLCESGQNLMGFVPKSIQHKDHVCECAPTHSTNWTYLVIHRKIGVLEATLQVAYCTPIATFEGNELQLLPGKLTTPLIVMEQQNKNTVNKKHCCLYCQKMLVEISSHLVKQHKNEPEVQDLLKFEVNSRERNRALKELRLKGDGNYNRTMEKSARIPVRELKTTDVRTCVSCMKCSALLAPRNFARHERKCTGRGATRERVIVEGRRAEDTFEAPVDLPMKEVFMRELLQPMRDDHQTHEVLSDYCLQQLTERYAHMHRGNPTSLQNDRQHLRRLARLLMEIREVDPSVIDFEDCILNASYDSLLEAVYKLCHLNETTGIFEKSALAQVLRSAITMLIKALSNTYLSKGLFKDSMEWQRVDRFLTLHIEKYGVYVGRSAGRTRLHQKAKRQIPLPDPSDIKKFSTCIAEEARKAYEALKERGYSYNAWYQLGQAELARTILFNRRRVGEVALMSLELYKKRTSVDESKKQRLSALEKALADRYSIMTLVAKRAHILHVLLDEEQCKHLDLFVELREKAGVAVSNDYLFGVPTHVLYLDASTAIRRFSEKCGAKQPNLLRATYLRKQVATMSQLLSLNDNQIAQVAKFMGHTKEVHNAFYRQDEQLFQVTSWAKFLLLVDDEDINKYKGKTLDEIVNLMKERTIDDNDPSAEPHVRVNEILDDESVDLSEPTEQEIRRADLDKSLHLVLRQLYLNCISFVETSTFDAISKETSILPHVSSPRNSGVKKIRTPSKRLQMKRIQTPPKTIGQILQTLENSPRRRHLKKRVFTAEEVRLMTLKFTTYISEGRLAPLLECQCLVEEQSSVFKERTGRDVYNWVQYRRNKKRQRNKK